MFYLCAQEFGILYVCRTCKRSGLLHKSNEDVIVIPQIFQIVPTTGCGEGNILWVKQTSFSASIRHRISGG